MSSAVVAKAKKKPVFQTMGDNMVLTDGTRSVELHQVDAYTPGAAAPKTPNPYSVNLEANVRRLRIDVDRILPLHGRIVPYGELLNAIGEKPAAAEK